MSHRLIPDDLQQEFDDAEQKLNDAQKRFEAAERQKQNGEHTPSDSAALVASERIGLTAAKIRFENIKKKISEFQEQ